MNIIAVIPARYHSTRFEGKVIAPIAGKPMIQHVYERTRECNRLDDVIIACDDERVKNVAESFGARTVLTKPDHPSGSDRIVEVVRDMDCDIIINVQGDEPLIRSSVIEDLIGVMLENQSNVMATVIKATNRQAELDDSNVVKVIVNQNQEALYFSRSRIPYQRDNVGHTYYKHLGIYAYTKQFLLKFNSMPKSPLEMTESLEQLRVLDAGYRIRTVETDIETIGVDTQEDLLKVEQHMKDQLI